MKTYDDAAHAAGCRDCDEDLDCDVIDLLACLKRRIEDVEQDRDSMCRQRDELQARVDQLEEKAAGWKAMHLANIGEHGCSWDECGRLRELRDVAEAKLGAAEKERDYWKHFASDTVDVSAKSGQVLGPNGQPISETLVKSVKTAVLAIMDGAFTAAETKVLEIVNRAEIDRGDYDD